MTKERCSSIIKLENFENAEALIENYRREFEIHRLQETLESMLIEEEESITNILNAAYNDYSLISTDLLPLVDSYLPSIKQFQEKIDSNVNDITSIIEKYSEEINSKINNHNLLFTKKLEQNLFKMCHDEIKRYREILSITKSQFNKDEASTSFLSIRIIHYCILRLLKIRKSIDAIYQTIKKKHTKLDFEFKNNKHYNDCFEICNNFSDELKALVIQASNNILQANYNKFLETEDFKQNNNILLQCIFLLNLKEEFISKVKNYIKTEIISNYNFYDNKDDKLLFSNVISDLENIIQGEKLADFINKIVFSLFNYDDTEFLMFLIDIYIQGILLFLLEHVESTYSEHIVSPTAPMDLFVHQLNSIISLIEKNEKILINFESKRIPANKLKELKLKILICFRENNSINNYSKKWKFGTYWNLIYRNILNRRISIRNEAVEFSKVYVYDNKKYWLKYSIEIIRQIRWILGNSSIHSNTPLPPSRYLVPLFTRCLYSSLLLLYDYSSYLLSFTELSSFSEKNSQNNSIWSSKTKPEHICCVLMDAISFEEWVKIHFINEIFFHIDQVKSEFGFFELFELSESENVLDIDQLKSIVKNELINQDYLFHINENLFNPLTNTISIYLKNQTIRIFETGLRAVPCLYRLTTTSISSKGIDKIDNIERVPSSYIENATKPIEVFLIFSLNAIKSVIADLSSSTIQKLREIYFNILFNTFEGIFEEIFDICEKQILSSKHQLASLQKLAQKNIGSAANRIDPNIIASQYMTDVDTWFTKMLKLISNFFDNLDQGSEKYIKEYINTIKEAPKYLKLYEILKN
ncbi:hypothetical protein CmeUKMEL1_18500 [Cryptosporidium meleagridis]|uniref:Uncharacterized protein n=1 Tax=Cryptosporidium meleagridis TaxID=93969 RepID=A0A2P4Z6G5_9CRYT|nr:hypothetical protein CmeUKMEL1_18500 [Cryptosporidium meleagridis]